MFVRKSKALWVLFDLSSISLVKQQPSFHGTFTTNILQL
jgi:hypothetical protein